MSFLIRDKDCPRCESPLNQELVWSKVRRAPLVIWICPTCWGKNEFWVEVVQKNGSKVMGLATEKGVYLW